MTFFNGKKLLLASVVFVSSIGLVQAQMPAPSLQQAQQVLQGLLPQLNQAQQSQLQTVLQALQAGSIQAQQSQSVIPALNQVSNEIQQILRILQPSIAPVASSIAAAPVASVQAAPVIPAYAPQTQQDKTNYANAFNMAKQMCGGKAYTINQAPWNQMLQVDADTTTPFAQRLQNMRAAATAGAQLQGQTLPPW